MRIKKYTDLAKYNCLAHMYGAIGSRQSAIFLLPICELEVILSDILQREFSALDANFNRVGDKLSGEWDHIIVECGREQQH